MKQNEEKEREKVSRETLGKFFYDLARTCFAAMIIGAIVGFFKKDVSGEVCVVLVTVGNFFDYSICVSWLLYIKA